MSLAITREMVDDKDRVKLKRIIDVNRERPASVIPVLQQVQTDFGYIPFWAIDIIARELNVPPARVLGIVTFYNIFSLFAKGQYTIQVCKGTACYVRGGNRILSVLSRQLGIRPGETTADRKFSLEVVRCLGCCGLSPVITMNRKVYRRVNPVRISEILQSCR